MMNKRNTPFRLAWVPENTLLAICAAVLLLVLAMMPAHAANVPTAIYLDGINGNDASDGSTAALAVRSFARAKELATINQGITTIYISGSVTVSGGVSLAGTNAMLVREPSYNAGVLLIVPSGETATFGNITIDGNSQQQVVTRYSLVSCLGTLNIEDGAVLQNNHIGFSTQRGRGGAIDCNRGTLNMTGGVIQDNQATHGGGILLQEGAVFNMSGGTIQNNKAINGPNYLNDGGAGGGVCMSDGATFNISGNALIQKNHSEEVGGGISVGSLEASQGHNRLVMTGGQIDQNSSGATGGGIFVQAGYASYVSTATITSGSITNNRMLGTGGTYYSFGGGGIYVNGFRAEGYSNGQLFLENVLITDNEAASSGGGYAACPITNTKIYLKNGAAIYGNQASSSRDIYIYSDAGPGMGAHAGNPVYEISSTMLGGVPYNWLYPDGTEVPLSQLSGTVTGDGTSFGMYTESVGNADTLALAKVIITGNYSRTRGGGIGSNGDVTIGEVDQFTHINVSKTWQDEDDKHGLRPALVEVELWRTIPGSQNQPVYVGFDRIVPDALTGAWALTIGPLAARDEGGSLYVYNIKERVVDHYTSQVQGFDIINTYHEPTGYPSLRVPLAVKKVLQNGILSGGEFTFQLKDSTGKVLAEAHNAADGTVSFPDRTFSNEVSGWTYTIHEVKGTNPAITYDSAVYTVKINTKAVEGKLQATVIIDKNGSPHSGAMIFTNTRELPPTGDSIYGTLPLLTLSSLLLAGAYAFRMQRKRSL